MIEGFTEGPGEAEWIPQADILPGGEWRKNHNGDNGGR